MSNLCLPEQFLLKLENIIEDKIDRARVIESFSHAKKISIRINTLQTTFKSICESLGQQEILFESVPTIPNALVVLNKNTREITALEEYKTGKIYIQSLSSMIPAFELDPQQDEKILDMAAAPGSKTSQLAALMQNSGEIIANDIDRNRIFKLHAVLKQLGITNTKVTSIAGQRLWQKYQEYFDRVLLDAPCSMEGRFNCNDPATIEHWSQKKVKNLSKLQKWLLRSAVSATKPGGTIVYSTCTISPEENEEVVGWILEKEPGIIKLTKKMRILPDDKMEAFFVAKFTKIRSSFT